MRGWPRVLCNAELPAGLFLTSFGQYVLTPNVFRALRSSKAGARDGDSTGTASRNFASQAGHFTEALDQLRQSEGRMRF